MGGKCTSFCFSWHRTAHIPTTKRRNKRRKWSKISNLPVVRRRAPAIVVREPAKRRMRPLERLCCVFAWPTARTPSELRRPSVWTVSENTDVDMVEAVESTRRLLPPMNVPDALPATQPPAPTPLDDVVVADESLRENIEWPSDDSLSFDSISDFSCSSFSGGARRRLQRSDRRNANIRKNVAIITRPKCLWLLLFAFFAPAFTTTPPAPDFNFVYHKWVHFFFAFDSVQFTLHTILNSSPRFVFQVGNIKNQECLARKSNTAWVFMGLASVISFYIYHCF